MHGLISHLRHTIRLLVKSPGFTITAIVILGLGIGTNTAIFSLINGVLLKPLPYPDPERLVRIFQPTHEVQEMNMAYSDYLDFRAGQHTLRDLTVFYQDDFQVVGNGDPERIEGAYVTGGFFDVMGRPFILGRPFGENEENAASHVAVISDRLWRTRFHADPKIVGTNITVNGTSLEIIGVTPEQADEIVRLDLYEPFSLNPLYADVKSRRSGHMDYCIGRLKEGITLRQAQAEFEVINRNLIARYPATSSGYGVKLVPLLDSVVGDYSSTLWLLGGAVVCLLLITCANTANLLLARATERTKEMTLRAALGASRKRLIAQLLSENLVLACLGGIAGLAASCWAIGLIKALEPGRIARLQEVSIDRTALIIVFVITLLTALLFGLLPALVVSRADMASALRMEGGWTGTAGHERHRSQSILVIGQVALASVLLIGAGLLLRSFLFLQSFPLGFRTQGIVVADIDLVNAKYANDSDRKIFFDNLLTKVKQLPGVVTAGINDCLPFWNTDYETLCIAGQPVTEPGRLPWMQRQIVSPDYFRALGIPLLRGRFFDNRDQPGAENTVIINESIAQRYFPGQDPIGKQLDNLGDLYRKPRYLSTIVGVVADARHNNPEVQQTSFQVYFPYSQRVGNFGSFLGGATLILQTTGNPGSLIPALRTVVANLDPDLPLTDVGPYEYRIARSFTIKRLSLVVVSLFSGVALLLAAIGLYAVVSYSVSRRIREIGVRIAIGAEPANIVTLVTSQGLRIVCLGLLIGIIAGIGLAQLIGNVLYGVSPTDPLTLAISTLVLGFAALLACLLPAFRAIRIDPIAALRE
ncbi:MAG: ABC transporter permease [Verrucomicrobia bacterium]|nr:ABC transporter permease [Verrucomicrobiota bacterium]